MRINQVPIWYAHYESKVPLMDEYGNETGEFETKYSNPVRMLANLSPARGEYDVQQFGNLGQYDKVMLVSDSRITESDILWIDSLSNGYIPVDPDGEHVMHDYIVTKIARSLNSVAIAVRRVNIS